MWKTNVEIATVNLPEDLRVLEVKERMFFMYTIGIDKAIHNASWAIRCHLNGVFDGLDIFMATDVTTPLHTIPFMLVSSGKLGLVSDPHIAEHKWKQISADELMELKNE